MMKFAGSKGLGAGVFTAMVFGLVGAPEVARAAIPYEDQITPGELRGIESHNGDAWPLGYWEYLPSNFEEMAASGHRYPLLITLSGISAFDPSSHCPNGGDVCWLDDCSAEEGLCRAARRGPPWLIARDRWDEDARPFITITPQNPAPTGSNTNWDRDQIDALIAFAIENYPVDPRRIYMYGNSQGGRGVLQYGEAYPRRLAAMSIGPGGSAGVPGGACMFQDTAFWAFHGEADDNAALGAGIFEPCHIVRRVQMYDHPELFPHFEACVNRVGTPYPDARMTMFHGLAHDVWTPAYERLDTAWSSTTQWQNDEACGTNIEFWPYSPDVDPDGVYSWMLSFDRPDTVAPDDFEVAQDAGSFELTATTEDDDALTYTWRQLEGTPLTITQADQATAVVEGFTLGESYTFEVMVVDADNQWDTDQVVVTIVEEVASTSGGETGQTEPGGTGEPGEDDSGPTETTTAGTTGDPAGGTSAAGPTTGAADDSAGSPEGDDEGSSATEDAAQGCSCRTQTGSGGAAFSLLVLLGLLRGRRFGRR